LGIVNSGSVELTLIVWKSESPPLALLRFKLGSNFEVSSVNGRPFPLRSVMVVFFRRARLRDEAMTNHNTANIAANVAMEAHQREGMAAAATTVITIRVVAADV
jgi:hypothetical protein